MAHSFTITTASEAVPVERGRGEAAYTVTNANSGALRGRAKVVALPPAAQTWFAIEGEAEQDYQPNETRNHRVRIAVPASSPAAKYTFRLDMVSVVNPDEDFTEGPLVSFDYKPAIPPRPFPWWVIPVAAAVLIVIGGFLLWWLFPRGGEPEQPKADFTAAPLSGPGPLSVQFHDKSGGGAMDWDWNFGDGKSSIDKDPTHDYTDLGTFKVSLRVRFAKGGEDTVSKEKYVSVTLAKPVAVSPKGHPIPPGSIIPDTGGGLHLTTKVRFKWEAVPLTGGYKLEVQYKPIDAPDFLPKFLEDVPSTDTTDILELGLVRDWRWRVRALSGVAGVPDTNSDWLEFGGP
jgi:PKD repeat protein